MFQKELPVGEPTFKKYFKGVLRPVQQYEGLKLDKFLM
jgi:hypothetical protein